MSGDSCFPQPGIEGDRFVYLLFGLTMLVVWVAMYVARPDLGVKMRRAGGVGLIAGPLAEIWYLRDYWDPPRLLHFGPVSLEDMLVGFGVAGVAAVIFDVVLDHRNTRGQRHHRRLLPFAAMFGLGLMALTLGVSEFGINSVVISSAGFTLFAGIMISIRRDLLKPAVFSAILFGFFVLVIYAVLFWLMSPDFWVTYGRLDYYMLPGNIPLTEAVWYFTWGALAGISYEFAMGLQKVPVGEADRKT